MNKTRGRPIRSALFALACTFAGAGVGAQTVAPETASTGAVLSAQELAVLATDLIALGAAPQARQLAQALLERDPNDRIAISILAQADFLLGDYTQARRGAARLYRLYDDPAQRYNAARLAALSAANEGRFTLSQWWLRLALVSAPSPQDQAQTMADASGVRAQNPWSTNVTLSFSPSNNVNNGSDGPFLLIDGVETVLRNSADAQALDGWIGSLAFSTRYRFRQTEISSLSVGLNANWRGVFLSGDARDSLIADNRFFGNRAFSFRNLETNLTYDRRTETGSLSLSSAIGSRFTFDDDQSEIERYLRLSARQSFTTSPTSLVSVSGFASQAWEIDPDRASSDDLSLGLSATYIRALPDVGTLSGTLAYTTTRGDLPNRNLNSWTISASFAPTDQIGPFDISGNIGYRFTDFPDYQLFDAVLDGRRDNRIFAGLELAIPEYSFAGFEPVITLDATHANSNISRFEYTTLGLGFTFQSSF